MNGADLKMEQTLTISWQVIGVLVSIVVVVVGIATAYIKLFVKAEMQTVRLEIAKAQSDIISKISETYVTAKDVTGIDQRLIRVEKRVFPELNEK